MGANKLAHVCKGKYPNPGSSFVILVILGPSLLLKNSAYLPLIAELDNHEQTRIESFSVMGLVGFMYLGGSM